MPPTRAGLAALAVLGIAAVAAAPAGAKGGGCTGTTMCGNGTLTWSPEVVWPPNHKLVTVNLAWNESSSDDDGDTNTLTVDNITSVGVDDKGAGQPSSKQGPDYTGVGNSGSASDGQPAETSVQVRAERSGTDKAGRTYKIDVTCHSPDDPMDGTASAIVTVPHDMGNHNGSSGASSKTSRSRSKTSSTSTSAPAAAPALTVTRLGAVTSVL
jgi:hypothetical protein